MQVRSPLTGSFNVVLENTFPATDIMKGYLATYNINVDRFFVNVPTIYLYKCLDTEYRFFYPYSIAGDGDFYRELQQFNWYYMDWKWEHEVCFHYLSSTNKVLEVGCAKGSFIEKLKLSGMDAVGLELNKEASLEGLNKGLNILNESVQQHATAHTNMYDVVCSFQVMEHIAEIKEVLKASVDLLKSNGKLIISVPNNDSFLGLDINYLNMPPHHMGLWNSESLKSLGKIFELQLCKIHYEPLQSYHQDYFSSTLINSYSRKYPLFSKLIRKTGPAMVSVLAPCMSRQFKAYTIQAVYEKR